MDLKQQHESRTLIGEGIHLVDINASAIQFKFILFILDDREKLTFISYSMYRSFLLNRNVMHTKSPPRV